MRASRGPGRWASVAGTLVTVAALPLSCGSAGPAPAGSDGPAPAGSARPPVVRSLLPDSGPEAGGTEVIIRGGRLGRATRVTVGGEKATFEVRSTRRLAMTVPPHAPGPVQVRVTTPAGRSPAGPDSRYRYRRQPDRCAAAVHDGSAQVASADLAEISGVVSSRHQPGALWVHNDSGSPPDVYALGHDGEHLGRFSVDGAQEVDWEDLAIGPGPVAGVDHLYIGDIGNNFGTQRGTDPVHIYRTEEPQLSDPPGDDGTTAPAAVIGIQYQDGPHDAETLLSDPSTGDLVVVSKQWDGTAAGLYEIPAAVSTAATPGPDPVTVPRAGSVVGSAGELITGGDISPDGSLIALRTYTEVWLWERAADDTVVEALAAPPTCRRAVAEPQGEAVGFDADGTSFVTISEGAHPPLNWFRMP